MARIAMSESSQFFATSTDATCRAYEPYELISARGRQFDLWSIHPFVQPKSVADRLQAPVFEEYSVLCRWADVDANGACSDAKLFICSPHSCEVVKTRFFHALLKT